MIHNEFSFHKKNFERKRLSYQGKFLDYPQAIFSCNYSNIKDRKPMFAFVWVLQCSGMGLAMKITGEQEMKSTHTFVPLCLSIHTWARSGVLSKQRIQPKPLTILETVKSSTYIGPYIKKIFHLILVLNTPHHYFINFYLYLLEEKILTFAIAHFFYEESFVLCA